ncbi:hypothetical protein ABZT47_20580 [Sphaerisporangium sp. NPDC005289]|uniref:hypothetical protein n=1 Tax=Sphaerisporangium sp. NPDC005289 TaxID=3155247 RepID=UPI00339E7AF7
MTASAALWMPSPHLDLLAGSVGLAAIEAFGLDVTRLHWDMTSISLHGDYDDADPAFARPRFGHPKDRRPDLKQVQAGIAVSGEGAIPVFHRAYDGAAGEVGQVIGAMQGLQKLAGPQLVASRGRHPLQDRAAVEAPTGCRRCSRC